jgi:fido (protein-threonine AMPylation protein)
MIEDIKKTVWATTDKLRANVFHYELEFIHPFENGNGRMGRLGQALILSKWGANAWLSGRGDCR